MKLGLSSCPNDIFIFTGILQKKFTNFFSFDPFIADVEELNKKTISKDLDIVKISYGILDRILESYSLLPAGGAMGFGVGPLLVAKKDNISTAKSIAIPGFNTTSFRVFKVLFPELYDRVRDNIVELRFDSIMPSVAAGKCDLGLIIHEGRFTYKEHGLIKIADLGELWDNKFQCPLPLGAIALKNELSEHAKSINELIIKSIDYANSNYNHVLPFIRENADEMDDSVLKAHIDLYVNKYSIDARLGIKGITALFGRYSEDIFHKV